MSDFSKKIFVMAIAVVCLTVAIISSFEVGNIINPLKSILKNTRNKNNIEILDCSNDADCLSVTSSGGSSSKGAVLMEQSSKRVLSAYNANIKMYPASTTKVLTALVVLNNLPLDRIVTVPKSAEGVEGSSIYLREGQKISVEDLLYGLMLRSGNDAAVALALETSKSIDAFAALMNETARRIGALSSNFINPHGLHDDKHYTTAYDLALITAAAYENKDFVKIVSTAQRKITVDGEARYIANKNKMLKHYDGANGVKTGYTKKSGRCLVSGAKRNGMQLICVVLNCPDMWKDSVRMLDFGFENYVLTPLDNALLTSGSKEVKVVVKQTVTADWHNLKYPVAVDGSERLIVEFA